MSALDVSSILTVVTPFWSWNSMVRAADLNSTLWNENRALILGFAQPL